MDVVFEWDEQKNASNWKKHRINFEEAIQVFADPNILFIQDREVEGEERWQAVGLAEDIQLLLVAHTSVEEDGTEIIRVISARLADRTERQRYATANG